MFKHFVIHSELPLINRPKAINNSSFLDNYCSASPSRLVQHLPVCHLLCSYFNNSLQLQRKEGTVEGKNPEGRGGKRRAGRREKEGRRGRRKQSCDADGESHEQGSVYKLRAADEKWRRETREE